jgi:predicted transcriptional regulator of viral defense system
VCLDPPCSRPWRALDEKGTSYVSKSSRPRSNERIAALATRQHGVVATRQLVALGLTRRAVSHRARAGRLHVVHRGVYVVGHADIGHRGRWMAAVLACGDRAALSHRAAAALWGIRAHTAERTDLTVPTPGGRAARDRLRIHRCPTLSADEVTIRDRIPVTSPARTVLDVAATLTPRQLERLLDQVEVERVTATARSRRSRPRTRAIADPARSAPGSPPTSPAAP